MDGAGYDSGKVPGKISNNIQHYSYHGTVLGENSLLLLVGVDMKRNLIVHIDSPDSAGHNNQ
tara:strand:+ start:304 stop:489 length:186 start_codon:yes stop_codon:yes gene_type:complete